MRVNVQEWQEVEYRSTEVQEWQELQELQELEDRRQNMEYRILILYSSSELLKVFCLLSPQTAISKWLELSPWLPLVGSHLRGDRFCGGVERSARAIVTVRSEIGPSYGVCQATEKRVRGFSSFHGATKLPFFGV